MENIDVEKRVLGQLLLIEDFQQLKVLSFQLREEDFTSGTHKEIFKKIQQLIAEGKAPSISEVAYAVDSELYILDLQSAVITTVDAETDVNILKDITVRRKLKKECNKAIINADNTNEKIKDVLNQTQLNIKSLATNDDVVSVVNTSESLFDTVKTLESLTNQESEQYDVPYDFAPLDANVTVLKKQLHIISALSSIGKTALALTCFYNQLVNGRKLIYFCGESSKDEIFMRLIAIGSGVSVEKQLKGINKLTAKEHKRFQDTLNLLYKYSDNYFIYGKGDYKHDHTNIRLLTEVIKNKVDIDMVYIDYLQHMKPSPAMKKADAWRQIEDNVYQISNLGGELNVAVTLLAQVNRSVRFEDKPRLYHLRGSSTIENEAHIITFLHRDEQKHKENPSPPTALYSEKVRLGSPFDTVIRFIREATRYEEKSRFEEDTAECGETISSTNTDNRRY